MPELPDVQVFKEYIDATSLHQPIKEVQIPRKDILGEVSASSLRKHLRGRELESVRRHGKYLLVELDQDGWLVLHFGMTGELKYARSGDPPDHTRLLLKFDDGQLAYRCTRMLGKVDWTDDADRFVADQELGIDGLSDQLDLDTFRRLMEDKHGTIKSALMDQSTIAGIGNVYSDEILFQAKIRPDASVGDLDDDQIKTLHRELKRVLSAAIGARARPEEMPSTFLLRCRNDSEPKCPRCGGSIETRKVSGRTSYFCPRCQSEP